MSFSISSLFQTLKNKKLIFLPAAARGGFICTFSLLISLSITLRTSKFMNQFTISSIFFDMVCYLKGETYSGPISIEIEFQQMTSELITFNPLRCHSSSRPLGTRTGYWKPTQRGTDENPLVKFKFEIDYIFRLSN